MADVTLDNICKTYENGFQAVTDLSLEINEGEFLVMVGPSGCGKSTTLRMIAGLEDISGGKLMIGDRVVNDVEPKDRDIAMVFQNYALYPHMTVGENIGFALKLRKTPRTEINERVSEAARILQLTDLLDRKPGQLSGGQRQRVAMGRAIVRKPRVFLLDEPLSNLDAKLRVQTRSEITRLQNELGVTTFYVTHDQVEAMTMADRVAVINLGVLQQVASPQELFDTPANLFVASFIGSPPMNLFEATIVEDQGSVVLDLGSQQVDVAGLMVTSPELRQHIGRQLIAGIRPKELGDAALDTASTLPRLQAEVLDVEALGYEKIVYLDVGATMVRVTDDHEEELPAVAPDGQDTEMAEPPTNGMAGRFDPRSSARIGEHIEITVDVENLHLFDPDTELALH
jgi:multiple sugar transport system ATP-binding protein